MVANRARAEWLAVGISREQWRLYAAACSIGGDVRVGVEDNFSCRMARAWLGTVWT